jgi:hypothetical protein
MKQYLFSYGTLQKEKVQLELFGRVLDGTSDALRGYKVTPVEIKDEAFLARGEQKHQLTAVSSQNKNDIIEGTALQITEEELSIADKYEPEGYKRIKVVLESGKEARLYVLGGNYVTDT